MGRGSLRIGHRVVVAVVALTLGFSGTALGQQAPRFLWGDGHPRFLAVPGGDVLEARREAAAGSNIPLWSGSFAYKGTTYPYTLVGTDPSAGSATSTVPVVIIPIEFVFADGTRLSPTDPVCGATDSAVTLVQNSPVFQDAAFSPGGTYVGTTQYIDAFQRANFWGAVSTLSPDYHVLLTTTVAPTQTVPVPRLVGSASTGPCAKIGQVNYLVFDVWARQTIKALGIPPTSLPLFISYNTFWTLGGCCILGYHGVASKNHTYAVAAFSDPGIFSVPIQDIHALSHEIGEWMNDPLVSNATPGWKAGQATVCQKNLEVGDPVTGIAFNLTMPNGFEYHPEDLTFVSWFARQSPSTAVNGWYTFLNSFASPPPVCH